MSKKRKCPLPRCDCICGICREILLEPVTLPCNHTLCHPCFQLTVEKANLCCPYCRRRVSNWARKNARSGTLVDKELWEIIQSQYPKECECRARGQDTVDDDFEDGLASYPAPLICEPGEIRQEYEAEINKIEAEKLSREEEESKASEEYIRKLLAEEEEEQRLLLEHAQRESEEQLKRDEELAWVLNNDMNESTASEQSSVIEVPVVSKRTPSSKSRKNAKAKPKQSGDIERFLSPKATQRVHIRSSQIKSEDLKNIYSSMGSNGSMLDSDEDSMPSLSPQFHLPASGREMQDSDSDLQIPCLAKCSPIDAAQSDLQVASSSGCADAETTKGNKASSNMATIHFTSPMSFKSRDDCGWQSFPESSNVTSSPKTVKRALESPLDGDSQTTQKRQKVSCMENNSDAELHTERLMQLEETFIQKKMQEEQDMMLAMKLQKLLDKEKSSVVRRKGSPDEYKLRPKGTSLQPGTLDITPLNVSLCNDSKVQSPESGDTSDENKLASKKCIQQLRAGVRHSSRTNPSEGVNVLRPSNKQQTIPDMFQRSAGK